MVPIFLVEAWNLSLRVHTHLFLAIFMNPEFANTYRFFQHKVRWGQGV